MVGDMTEPEGTTMKIVPDTDDLELERVYQQRCDLLSRRAKAVVTLMEERQDLRGVHALADFVADSVRWSA